MRIFICERILLSDLSASGDAPQAGDLVLYFRDAQNLDNGASLRAKGVTVERGPDLLDKADIKEIDAFLNRYLKEWFLEDGTDVTRDGDLSLGMFLSGQLSSIQKPPLIVTLGEICRRVLHSTPPGTTVLCDIRAGETVFANQIPHPDISPRRRLVRQLAEDHGCAYRDLVVTSPLPNIHRSDSRTGSGHHRWAMFRSFLGGLRPVYILGRLKAALRDRARPIVYVYFNHGIRLVARALVERGSVFIYGDRADVPGVIPLRFDHMVASPPEHLRAAAKRLRRRLEVLKAQKNVNGLFVFRGFDYGPFLLGGISHYLSARLPIDLLKMAQGIKLLRRFRCDLTVINGDTPSMYAAIGYARRLGGKVVHIDHGLNMFVHGLRNGFLNQPHVIYVSHGTDHCSSYGIDLPPNRKPERPLLGNPATAIMNPIRGRRAIPPRRRVLFANYTPHYANNSARFHNYDRYMMDILTAARDLLNKSVSVGYRPHHGENPDYIRFMIDRMGLTGRIRIDETPAFEDALVEYDAFVANTTSCIYQALFAGWPTIFYDPAMDLDYFIGMPAATDIFRPIADTPEQLVAMVEQAFDPESEVARFPERFRTTYAERFIGRGAERADEVIADFIIGRLSGQREGVAA